MTTTSKTHGSLILLDALASSPYKLSEGYPAFAKSQLQGYIDAVNQVMAQALLDIPGYNEPFVIVNLTNGTEIESTIGHWRMSILGYNLLLEDYDEVAVEHEEDYYHTINILNIKSLRITCG